jgi:hypothetical protein
LPTKEDCKKLQKIAEDHHLKAAMEMIEEGIASTCPRNRRSSSTSDEGNSIRSGSRVVPERFRSQTTFLRNFTTSNEISGDETSNMSKDDLWASVIGTCHLKESVFELGIEVETKLEEGKALLRVITPGNPVKYAGPFKSSDLRHAAQVLNQVASLLDTKRKVKHFVVPPNN